MRRLIALTPLLVLLACGESEGPTFTEAVSTVYTPCDPDPIKLKAATKNLQLAFSPCGSNNFLNYAWSPNGLNLYYRASQGAWVEKDTGENYPLRIGMPRGGPAWINSEILAYPDRDGRKIGVYQVSAHVLNLVELDHIEPDHLTKGIEADEVLFSASDTPGGVRDIYRFHANTGETEKAFDWMSGGVETFTYQPKVDVVCLREFAATDVECRKGESGERVIKVRGRDRGSLSTDGRFLVTEGPGTPVAVMGAEMANRPSFLPETITPPQFWIHEVATGKELEWTGVHGKGFQWYTAADYWGSFLLWGFDDFEVNRNVTLGDLRAFMQAGGFDVSAPPPAESKPVTAAP